MRAWARCESVAICVAVSANAMFERELLVPSDMFFDMPVPMDRIVLTPRLHGHAHDVYEPSLYLHHLGQIKARN